MWNCAFCEQPLVCDACNSTVIPPDEQWYDDFNEVDKPVLCPECETLLICHWCKTPYDGNQERES